MGSFKFEGDFETLSEPQLKLIESILQKQGFKDGKVVVEPVGQKGDNYVANVKRFIYEKSDATSFKMIGKVAPVAEVLREMLNTMVMFNNEIEMYQKVIPKFNTVQNSSGAPINERIRFPICYGILNEAPNELILLEDLGEEDFKMLDKFQPLSNASVKLGLKDLAIYHSLSYALKNIDAEYYKNSSNKLINIWEFADRNVETKMFFEMVENDMKALMDSEEHKKVISGTLSEIASHIKKNESYEKTSTSSVILHGDCWVNNILFRLEDGKPVQSIMIDYQCSRESNPACDILYFIFNCTDHQTRMTHFHDWISYYHEVLNDSLANHGLKSNRMLPRDRLDADLRRYGKMMLGFGIMLTAMTLRESKDVVDFKGMEGANIEEMSNVAMTQLMAANLDDHTFNTLKQRVTGLVESAIELGLV